MSTWKIVGLVLLAVVVTALILNYYNKPKKKCGCKDKVKEKETETETTETETEVETTE